MGFTVKTADVSKEELIKARNKALKDYVVINGLNVPKEQIKEVEE